MIVIDMELPKNCLECPMNHGEYTPNEIEKQYCRLTHRQFSKGDYKKRPTSCPMQNLNNAIRGALELLKKQEPMKPERVLGVLPDWYHCGACGMDMLDTGDGYRPKYCPQCGRAVKWDG